MTERDDHAPIPRKDRSAGWDPFEDSSTPETRAENARLSQGSKSAPVPDEPDTRTDDWLRALSAAEDEDAVFALLPEQRAPRSKLARQQTRGRLIKILSERFSAFGSGASAAMTADAWLSDQADASDDLQGREYVAEETEPWAESVDGAAVLDEAAKTFGTYLFSTRENLTVLALFSTYTHCFDVFGISPILDISSPTKRCGKSTAVVVLRHLCAQPLLSGNITPAALFRSIEAWKPTLLVDEADTFLKMADELRGILNAGHTRDTAFTVRAEGDSNEPRMFSTWAPKVVAAIGRLPDTIEDRSIRVVLARKPTTTHKADAFDPSAVREACELVRRRLARFVLDNLDVIAGNKVERPPALNDRAWNNWKPLFMIAKAVGGDWPDRCLEAALALAGREDADDEDASTLLLRHTWEAMGSPTELGARISTSDLMDKLIERDDALWAKWWAADAADDTRRKVVASSIAHRLKPFGIQPTQFKIEGEKARGYGYDEAFATARTQYLDLDGTDGTDGTTRMNPMARSVPGSLPVPTTSGGDEGGDGTGTDQNHEVGTDEPAWKAGGTEVPTGTDLFGGSRGCVPRLGDSMFPSVLAKAHRDGHIDDDELAERFALHKFVVRGAAS
jgi:Protein of unknown function (DUF3631)